jgi:hypothetical protein
MKACAAGSGIAGKRPMFKTGHSDLWGGNKRNNIDKA